MSKSSMMTLIATAAWVAWVAAQALAGGEYGGISTEGKGQRTMKMGATSSIFQSMPRVSKLLGAEVRTSSNEKLGRIHDLVMDPQGRVRYVILSKGGVMGIGAHLVAIPIAYADLRMNPEGHLISSIDKPTIAAAPGFASDEWPDFSNSRWQNQVRGYFGSGRRHDETMKQTPDRKPMGE